MDERKIFSHERISLSERVKQACSWKILSWNAAKNSNLMRWRCSHMHTFLSQAFSCSLDKVGELQNSISVDVSSRTVNKGHRFVSQHQRKNKRFSLYSIHRFHQRSLLLILAEAKRLAAPRLERDCDFIIITSLGKLTQNKCKTGPEADGKEKNEQQSPPKVLWWPELMGFKSKSLINP